MRILCIFSFLFFINTLFLYVRSCDHFYTYIVLILFICGCMVLSPIFTCIVSFLSLYTCFLFLYAIYYFCFTQKCLDEFCFKCFKNIGCQSLSYHKLSSCKVFSRVCVRIDFIVFNKWVWVEWFTTSLICSFVCYGFVTDCQRGRLLGHM